MYSVFFSSCECNRFVFFLGGGGLWLPFVPKSPFKNMNSKTKRRAHVWRKYELLPCDDAKI